MTLRPEYSLGHSQYNDFLFADVGAKTDGEELTVLSALVRLDIDPWHEAARLSDLPRDVAATSLARTLARLPDTSWKVADSDANVARLVAILPTGSTPEIPATLEARNRGEGSRSAAAPSSKGREGKSSMSQGKEAKPLLRSWVFWGGLAAAGFLLFQYLQTDNNLEPPNRPTTEQR